jgi:hypothetical protein
MKTDALPLIATAEEAVEAEFLHPGFRVEEE